MNKKFLACGALLAGLGVALGAFGAHGLQNITSDQTIIRSYQTGVQYELWHAFALLITGILSREFPGTLLKAAGICFITGILLFSGSLYLLTWFRVQDIGSVKVIGPVTPIGGLFFIAGWLFLLLVFLKRDSHPKAVKLKS